MVNCFSAVKFVRKSIYEPRNPSKHCNSQTVNELQSDVFIEKEIMAEPYENI